MYFQGLCCPHKICITAWLNITVLTPCRFHGGRAMRPSSSICAPSASQAAHREIERSDTKGRYKQWYKGRVTQTHEGDTNGNTSCMKVQYRRVINAVHGKIKPQNGASGIESNVCSMSSLCSERPDRQWGGLVFWRLWVRIPVITLSICRGHLHRARALRGYCMPWKGWGVTACHSDLPFLTPLPRRWLWSTATRSCPLGYFSSITSSW